MRGGALVARPSWMARQVADEGRHSSAPFYPGVCDAEVGAGAGVCWISGWCYGDRPSLRGACP